MIEECVSEPEISPYKTLGTPTPPAPSSPPTLERITSAGVFDVSSTSGGGTDTSNITRIFRVEESNAETYFVVQVNYTLSISTM